jgi:hypothetical protein
LARLHEEKIGHLEKIEQSFEWKWQKLLGGA